jgi:hypothetical protein
VLAIYREALNMRHFHSLPYAVLGFYKIFESAYPGAAVRSKKLEEEVAKQLKNNRINMIELREIGFDRKSLPADIAEFLRKSGRNAVAHANKIPTINPDETGDQRKMSVAAAILQTAARSCIRTEFGIGTNRWDQGDLR